MAAQEVTSRKLAGEIRRAHRVFVYVEYGTRAGDGVYIEVPKTSARLIVTHMRAEGGVIAKIDNKRDGLYIG
jgi:hypothetical protein